MIFKKCPRPKKEMSAAKQKWKERKVLRIIEFPQEEAKFDASLYLSTINCCIRIQHSLFDEILNG